VLNRTLLRLEVDTETIKAFKAVFIIILMVISSPVVRAFAAKGAKWVRAMLGGAVQLQTAVEADAAVGPASDISAKKEV